MRVNATRARRQLTKRQCICNIMLCNIACTRSRLHRGMVSSPPRRHLDVPRIELRSLLCHKSVCRASSVPYTFHKLSNNCRSVFVVWAMLHPALLSAHNLRTNLQRRLQSRYISSRVSLTLVSLVLGNYLHRPLVIKQHIHRRGEIEITILSRQIAILMLVELILCSLCHLLRFAWNFLSELQLKIAECSVDIDAYSNYSN